MLGKMLPLFCYAQMTIGPWGANGEQAGNVVALHLLLCLLCMSKPKPSGEVHFP